MEPPGGSSTEEGAEIQMNIDEKRTNGLAHVFQDDMLNAYQGSDGGKAFSFVP
jgi:hypothetical protein